jgi:hypothetical protein
MPKITKAGGATYRPPRNVIDQVMTMHADAESFASIASHLNRASVVRPDHDGVPRPGLWSKETVAELIEENTP